MRGCDRSSRSQAPDVGWCSRGREDGPNEDYVLYRKGVGACVADGIGGASLGGAIARYACHCAMHALVTGDCATDAMDVARREVARFVERVDAPLSGTSLVVLSLADDRVEAAWAGDVAVFCLMADERHTLVSSLGEVAGPIRASRLGRSAEGEPSVLSLRRDGLLSLAICTDGAWRAHAAAGIGKLLSKDESARLSASRLAFGGVAGDDATALVARFRPAAGDPAGDAEGGRHGQPHGTT